MGPIMDKASFLLFLLFLIIHKSSQKDNCNNRIAGKLVSLDNEYWPGYQLGIHRAQKRAGTILSLSLVSSGDDVMWMTEKCRDQVCFSRYRYDQREMGDYYKDIGDEKNYFYITRFGGLIVNHVWQHELNAWKNKKPSEGESVFYGFDVLCDSCDTLNHCNIVTKKNKIKQWNKEKLSNMMATSSGWVEFSDGADEADEWTITTFNKDWVPAWQLGPSSALRTFASSTLIDAHPHTHSFCYLKRFVMSVQMSKQQVKEGKLELCWAKLS